MGWRITLWVTLVVVACAFLYLVRGILLPFIISFIIAAVLLAYAVPRLLAAFRALTEQPDNKAAISQVFGRSGTNIRCFGRAIGPMT